MKEINKFKKSLHSIYGEQDLLKERLSDIKKDIKGIEEQKVEAANRKDEDFDYISAILKVEELKEKQSIIANKIKVAKSFEDAKKLLSVIVGKDEPESHGQTTIDDFNDLLELMADDSDGDIADGSLEDADEHIAAGE